MDGKLYIKKIIRDDGEQLEFDGEEILLAEKNTLLVRPDPSTTAVEYTEADGGEMVRQRNAIYNQTINGLIVPKMSGYWALSSKLGKFFKVNKTYQIVYIKSDMSMFKVENAWISSGLQIIPVPYEEYSEWNITFAIGNPNWFEYAEDSGGSEIYSNNVILPLLTANAGGEIWDAVGLSSDNVGEEWEKGAGGVQTVSIASTQAIYPVWTVVGPCVNPTLQNNTTDTVAEYNGTVASGQTLVVDFAEGVARLNTALVTRNVSGLVSLAPGDNTLGFNSDGGTTETSTISWNNIIN
jgi:hypothetical protein